MLLQRQVPISQGLHPGSRLPHVVVPSLGMLQRSIGGKLDTTGDLASIKRCQPTDVRVVW